MNAQESTASNPWRKSLLNEATADYVDHPTDATTLNNALSAWQRLFGDRQATLGPKDSIPLQQGPMLGSGGIGVVYEATLDGIVVAWKRTYTRKLTDWHLNEAKILGQISADRHKHIVTLIGSYIHRQRKGTHELAILTWPVARCDLSMLLHDMDLMLQWKSRDLDWDEYDCSAPAQEDEKIAFENLVQLAGLGKERSRTFTWILRENVLAVMIQRLQKSMGCIATAVEWLHDHHIRHKDLKPSQVLISSNGLWLSDFGWSKDISQLTSSETSGGDRITIRYHAPERAHMLKCGRPEDIFALGCTFLEMAYRTRGLQAEKYLKSKGVSMWSFQDNLDHLHTWFEPLLYTQSTFNLEQNYVTTLIQQMMDKEPDHRPTIVKVRRLLQSSTNVAFCDACCSSQTQSMTAASESEAEETVTYSEEYGTSDNDHVSLMGHLDRLALDRPKDVELSADDSEEVVKHEERGNSGGEQTRGWMTLSHDHQQIHDEALDERVLRRRSDPEVGGEIVSDRSGDEGGDEDEDEGEDEDAHEVLINNPALQNVLRRREGVRQYLDSSQIPGSRHKYDPRISLIFAAHREALERNKSADDVLIEDL